MRACFSDEKLLMAKAKESVASGYSQVKNWWVKKYNLPANHELFETQSLAEITLEMFEDMLLKKKEIEKQLETASSKQVGFLYEQLNVLNAALGEAVIVEDELVDRWERELEQGITPDLNER